MISKILEKVKNEIYISEEEILELLHIENLSKDYYDLICTSNTIMRKKHESKGYIFAQIGINAEPCSKNCKFCSMAEKYYSVDENYKKTAEEIVKECKKIYSKGVNDIFLMSTADYNFNEYVSIVKKVREILPKEIRLVGNLGDFDLVQANILKQIGITGIYHVHRLGEGTDTEVDSEIRIKTLNAIKEAGLELYYCIEPIGPEHTYEEITKEILRARDLETEVMAVMKRTNIQGMPLAHHGEIDEIEVVKIAAVSALAVLPTRAMNVHEVSPMSLLAGINQLYAESGANPRDFNSNTEKNRGYDVENVRKLLKNADYKLI